MNEPNYILLESAHDKNDKEAIFSEIFLQYYPALCYFAQKILRDKEESEDIVMKVFDRLWSNNQPFSEERTLKAYLYTAVKNSCYDAIKYARIRKLHQPDLIYLTESSEDGIINKMIITEFLRSVYNEIEALPNKCKEVFKLAYLDGMSHADIAINLQISTDNVKVQKARAIHLLRIVLLKKEALIVATTLCLLFELWYLLA